MLSPDEADGDDSEDDRKDQNVAQLEGGFHEILESSRFGEFFCKGPLIEMKGLTREPGWLGEFYGVIVLLKAVFEGLDGGDVVGLAAS